MPEQLHFDLPRREAMGPDDYFVSSANAEAYAMVSDDAAWPDGKLAVIGPPGSGKTHLVRLWQSRTGAEIRNAATLDPDAPMPGAGARIAVEDADRLPHAAEEYVFHLHNHLRATGGRLLLTATTAPSRWPTALPDLASRMQAASVVRIDDPDDDLLRAVLTKLFADRQLNPRPELIAYVLPRIERSFAAAGRIVADLDAAALTRSAQKRGDVMTVSLARAILDNGGHPVDD